MVAVIRSVSKTRGRGGRRQLKVETLVAAVNKVCVKNEGGGGGW